MITKDSNWQSSIRGLVEVCRFLLSNGSGITNGSDNVESIFHRKILLIQQGFQLNEEVSRKDVFEVLIKVLKLLSPEEKADEQTPLHLCRTWIAVKLLLDAGANPNDVDLSGQSPFLVTAKAKNSITKTDSFYADVIEDPETFWKSAFKKGLDPWVADKQGESLLSVFVKSEAFVLARALVEVACEENYATNDVKLSLLNVISKEKSKHTHWKTILADIILHSSKTHQLSLDSPFHFCVGILFNLVCLT